MNNKRHKRTRAEQKLRYAKCRAAMEAGCDELAELLAELPKQMPADPAAQPQDKAAA